MVGFNLQKGLFCVKSLGIYIKLSSIVFSLWIPCFYDNLYCLVIAAPLIYIIVLVWKQMSAWKSIYKTKIMFASFLNGGNARVIRKTLKNNYLITFNYLLGLEEKPLVSDIEISWITFSPSVTNWRTEGRTDKVNYGVTSLFNWNIKY